MDDNNKKKVLILSGIKWNDTMQRHQTFARIWANIGYEVYFVEGIVSSAFSIKKLFRFLRSKRVGCLASSNEIPSNVHVIHSKYINPNNGMFAMYNRRSNRKVISKIGDSFDIVINYLPINTTYDFINRIKYKMLIYDCVRDFQNWGGYPKNLGEIEEWLCNKAEYIFTDSFYLTNKLKEKWGKKVVQFLPTIDTELCEYKAPLKKEIKHLGYIGTLGEHIDVGLLKELQKKDYILHIFGTIDIPLDFSIINHGFFSDLRKMFLEVISSVDALLIPYKGNMDGVIPAKTVQCLAVGLPVFISEFYDSRFLQEYFYVYGEHEDLFHALEFFNAEDFSSKLTSIMQFVNKNSTAALTNRIKELLHEQ